MVDNVVRGIVILLRIATLVLALVRTLVVILLVELLIGIVIALIVSSMHYSLILERRLIPLPHVGGLVVRVAARFEVVQRYLVLLLLRRCCIFCLLLWHKCC